MTIYSTNNSFLIIIQGNLSLKNRLPNISRNFFKKYRFFKKTRYKLQNCANLFQNVVGITKSSN